MIEIKVVNPNLWEPPLSIRVPCNSLGSQWNEITLASACETELE